MANIAWSIALIRDGEVRWIESRSFISYDSDGSPQRVIGVNIDITERKRAEEHQRVLVAELDHRVKNVLATVSAVAGQTLETSKLHAPLRGCARRPHSVDGNCA